MSDEELDGRAVIILSGGVDSATAACMARARGRELFALTVDYGQALVREIESAKAIAKTLGIGRHEIVAVGLSQIGGSALTDRNIAIPTERSAAEIGVGVPATYVPFRNAILLSLAVALAEVVDAREVWGGWNVVDYSGYPDCRDDFLRAFEAVANLGTRAGAQEGKRFRVVAPLLRMGKADILREGLRLGLDYGLTWSCYKGGTRACGKCDSCQIRLAAWREIGQHDPIEYETSLG